MHLLEGLQEASRSITDTLSGAQQELNTQHCARVNSSVCKRCQADQIQLEGQLRPVPATQPEQVPECLHSFQG